MGDNIEVNLLPKNLVRFNGNQSYKVIPFILNMWKVSLEII